MCGPEAKKNLDIMLCYLPLSINVQCRGGQVPPCRGNTKALPAEALNTSDFQRGGGGQALGDRGQAVPSSMGRCLHQKWRCRSSCFNTSSDEEDINPAMAQDDKAFQN